MEVYSKSKNALEGHPARKPQLAVGVGCYGRDVPESARSIRLNSVSGGIAKLRCVGEIECLGTEDKAIPLGDRKGSGDAGA